MAINPLLLGPRVEEYQVDVLDTTDGYQGALVGVTSGKVTHNVDATIRGGFQIEVDDLGGDIDWATTRLRPWVRANGVAWPLGVYLPASPEASYTATGKSWSIPCLDKLAILDEDKLSTSYSLAAGTVVTDAVTTLIEDAGETSIVSEASTATTTALLVWPPGTSRLQIVNDLLASINYWSVWADGYGHYRIQSYVRPQDRAVTATFQEGETSIHSPEWKRTQDIAGVPNRVIAITSGDDDTAALTSTVENTDASSPYSYAARGNRWITKVYENVEAADQTTLDDIAYRYLWESSTPPAYLDVQHAVVPLNGNEVVRFVSGDVDVHAVVNEWGVDLVEGSWMTGRWVEVLPS